MGETRKKQRGGSETGPDASQLTAFFTDEVTENRVEEYRERVRQHVNALRLSNDPQAPRGRGPLAYAKQRITWVLIEAGRNFAREEGITAASSETPEEREEKYRISLMLRAKRSDWEDLRKEALSKRTTVEVLANIYLKYGLDLLADQPIRLPDTAGQTTE